MVTPPMRRQYTRIRRQHSDVLINIQDSKIASEFISFRERRFFYGTFT